MKRQIAIFLEHKDSDADDLLQRADNVKAEFDSASGCFELLTGRLADTPSAPYFLSILQNLLLVRDDIIVRYLTNVFFSSFFIRSAMNGTGSFLEPLILN